MRELRDLRAPGEDEARERALRLALAEHPVEARPRRRPRPALVAAATAAVAVAVVSPPGSAVADWVG
ncbi:MAG TPA: hypothetical protein VHF89_19050, partial [Solirubrobacteraceae bacterium]|nr:hypothetical protein [Solirubrobacteraceae bacterium]